MVKEFLKENYLFVLALGFSATLAAMFLSYNIFKVQSDIVMILLTTLGLAPLMYHTMKIEESYDMHHKKEWKDLKHHFPIFGIYLLLFFGAFLAFLLAYLSFSEGIISSLFSTQLSSIGSHLSFDSFFQGVSSIFMNNAKILLLCIILSLFYGSGALLILLWNASVLAVVIGDFIRENASNSIFGGFSVLWLFGIHGIFEILAYFIGAFAGGIISVAIIRHHWSSKKFKFVLKDATTLVAISVLVLFIGSIIEMLVL